MKSHTWLKNALAAFCSLILFVGPTEARTGEKALTFGGHTLGEGLSDFTAKFPSAVCQSPAQAALAEVGTTLGLPEKPGLLRCLVDGPIRTLAFPSLNVRFAAAKSCVRAIFNQKRLTNLTYIVEGSAADDLLTMFENQYGPVMHKYRADDGSERISIDKMVGWAHGAEVLNLSFMSVKNEVPNGAAALSNAQVEKLVVLHLYDRRYE